MLLQVLKKRFFEYLYYINIKKLKMYNNLIDAENENLNFLNCLIFKLKKKPRSFLKGIK